MVGNMNRIFKLITPYMKYIHYETKPLNSKGNRGDHENLKRILSFSFVPVFLFLFLSDPKFALATLCFRESETVEYERFKTQNKTFPI